MPSATPAKSVYPDKECGPVKVRQQGLPPPEYGGDQLSILREIRDTLKGIQILLAPPTNVIIVYQALATDGPMVLVPAPLPESTAFFSIFNESTASPLFLGYNQNATLMDSTSTTGVDKIQAGEFRSYEYVPNGGIVVARTAGDSVAGVRCAVYY